AARGDRALARRATDRGLRRRADGQPRLEDRRRDPRAAAVVDERPRPDDGDGHARRAGGLDRGSRAVSRGRRDREGARTHRRERDPRDDDRNLEVIVVALRGLLGRKLRTILTAVAIVLGVAMVSGTFVLTDSIDKAFNLIF